MNTCLKSDALGPVVNINMTAGETLNTQFTFGGPLNVTGYSFKATIKSPPPASSTLAELTTGNGLITLTMPASGIINFDVPSATTAAWAPGTYQWDMWMVDTGGNETRLWHGLWTVAANISPVP